MQDLNSIIKQINKINIFRPQHSTTAEYTFLSGQNETFTRIYHILVCETISVKADKNRSK